MRRRFGPFYNCPMGTRVRHAVARGPDEPVADLTEHDVVHRGMRVDLERLARAVRDLSPTSRISDTGRRRPAPLAAGLRGDWRTAAAGWTELGEQYESALELAESGAIDETLEALRILDRLGCNRGGPHGPTQAQGPGGAGDPARTDGPHPRQPGRADTS